ncbi:MAG: N-acetylmuramoyl-L-alanine amidase family protein [Opitutaceae bacterium]
MRVGGLQLCSSRLVFSSSLFGWLIAAVFAAAVPATVEARDYVDLGVAAERLGMKSYWLSGYKTYRLKSRWTTIDAGKNSKSIKINQLPVYLGFPTREWKGRLLIAKADYQHVLLPILIPQVFGSPPPLRRIVIDAGHGGRDHGACNESHDIKEKDLTLDVSRRLKPLLESAGFDVVMTRDSDVYIPLAQRPMIANRADGDLFLSLHFNAAGSATAAGFESFALTPQFQASSKFPKPTSRDNTAYKGNQNDAWNTLAGYHLQRSLVRRLGGPDRGLKRARFLVLKHLDCPGVLIELGFVSHPETAQKVRTAAFRQTLAQSLFEGIVGYSKRIQRIQK